MKAITVRQPWAWLITNRGKDIENRSWLTHYRGPLLIHAGADYQPGGRPPKGVRLKDRDDPALVYGAILGVVDLVDVVRSSKSRWHHRGAYGFVLRRPRRLNRPIPCKGRLGLWTPTPGQIRAVTNRLK